MIKKIRNLFKQAKESKKIKDRIIGDIKILWQAGNTW